MHARIHAQYSTSQQLLPWARRLLLLLRKQLEWTQLNKATWKFKYVYIPTEVAQACYLSVSWSDWLPVHTNDCVETGHLFWKRWRMGGRIRATFHFFLTFLPLSNDKPDQHFQRHISVRTSESRTALSLLWRDGYWFQSSSRQAPSQILSLKIRGSSNFVYVVQCDGF